MPSNEHPQEDSHHHGDHHQIYHVTSSNVKKSFLKDLKQPTPFNLPKIDSFQNFTTSKRLQALSSRSSSTTSLQSLSISHSRSRSPTPSNLSLSPSPSPSPSPSLSSDLSSAFDKPQPSIFASEQTTSFQHQQQPQILAAAKPLTTTCLCPGTRLQGYQHSGHSIYEVTIDLKEVDLEKGFVNGTLNIKGLTETHPEIITFFKGELINENNSFVTGDYDTTTEIDYAHWSKFPYFPKLGLSKYTIGNHTHANPLSHEMLFMRWKEEFIYTNTKLDSIEGASFAGFYYICFNQRTGEVKGYYYHKSSERFQKLELHHCGNSEAGVGSFETYEFL